MAALSGPASPAGYDYYGNKLPTTGAALQGPASPAGYNYYGNKVPNGYVQPTAAAPSVLGANTGPSNNASSLISALMSKGYNAIDAQNAASGPNAQNLMNEYLGAARSSSDAELSSLNTAFDQNKETLLSQLGGLDTQKTNSLATLNTEMEGVKNQIATSRKNSEFNTQSSISDAGSTAKNTQNKNRNVLRALGILNSSAAGDILARPMEQFDKERSRLVELGNQRTQELDNFMNQKTAEHANAVRQIESQYTQLVGDIQRDLRFNDRQRSDAIRSANAALQQRMAEIAQAQRSYEQQVALQKQNFMQGLAQQAGYTMPKADLQKILTSAIQGSNYAPSNVGIAQDDPRKRLLSGV